MPRYFFHTEDGQCLEDEEGTEVADLDAARVEAVRIMGQLLDEDAAGLWSTESFRIVVKNETGLTLFTVDASVMSSPSASKSHLHSNGLISPEEG